MKPHLTGVLLLMTCALSFGDITIIYIDASGRPAGERDVYINGRWIGEAPSGLGVFYFVSDGFQLPKEAPFGSQSPGWERSCESLRVQIGNRPPVLVTEDAALVYCPKRDSTAVRAAGRVHRTIARQGDVSSLYRPHYWIKKGGKFYPP